ncbi:MAG: amidohydrolase family protein [Anaerolineales bacterium]
MRVDAHQHFWNLSKTDYPWLTAEHSRLYRTFHPRDLEPLIRVAGIERTVLVQACDSLEDTVSMLTQAEDYAWIGAVVGWAPLLDHAAERHALDRLGRHPKFRGIRHLIHGEADPDWVVQPPVIEGLRILADYGLAFDVAAAYPNHLKHVPVLAEQVPSLTLIIDHLGAAPIKDKEMGGWAEQLAAAAAHPNVYAKLSGLTTAADWESWTVGDLQPYADYAIEQFGAERVMFGSDWPVSLQASEYARVWEATHQMLASRPPEQIDAILGETARKVYRIEGG